MKRLLTVAVVAGSMFAVSGLASAAAHWTTVERAAPKISPPLGERTSTTGGTVSTMIVRSGASPALGVMSRRPSAATGTITKPYFPSRGARNGAEGLVVSTSPWLTQVLASSLLTQSSAPFLPERRE